MQRQILLILALLGAGVSALRGQVVDTVITHIDTVVVAPEAVAGVGEAPEVVMPMSPRGAFIRSMVIPGWGQSAFGAYTRGGIYFAGWTGNWFMNFKNHVRLSEARNRLDLRTAQVRDSLIFSPPEPGAPPNPDSMRAVLDTTDLLLATVRQDPIGSDLQGLVSSREQQREDWIAWSLFWILASGIDAYVTAHLADFPATIELEPNLDRSVSVRIDVPLPRRRP
jgi:hypothetical protein